MGKEARNYSPSMSYASHTRNDSSRLKRLIHHRRMVDALKVVSRAERLSTIVDFGAGDGDMCCHFADAFPAARLHCYEPAAQLRTEAEQHCAPHPSISVIEATTDLPDQMADLVFCTEVFEHLPEAETDAALNEITRLVRADGLVVISVPAEIYVAGFAKGCFRFLRRRGQFDARPRNILKAALGMPIQDRPIGQIGPGLAYHFHHTGFDYRQFARRLSESFEVTAVVGSPFAWLPPWMNSEVYFSLKPRSAASEQSRSKAA